MMVGSCFISFWKEKRKNLKVEISGLSQVCKAPSTKEGLFIIITFALGSSQHENHVSSPLKKNIVLNASYFLSHFLLALTLGRTVGDYSHVVKSGRRREDA